MDKKTVATMFVIGFIILTIYLWKHNDEVANIIAHDGAEGILLYFISNANYILILISILFINREVNFGRNLIGGLMMIYAMDIVSYPRLSPTGITKDISLLASSDALVVNKLLSFGMSYTIAYDLYYLALPIFLIIVSLGILGISEFVNNLFMGKK